MVFSGEQIVAELISLGITHVIWVPDASMGTWESALVDSPELQLIRVCREGEAWPLAAGLILGGKTPIVIIQTTGLFESGDALRSILLDLKIPVVSIIGARNWLNRESSDTAKKFAEPILKAWDLEYLLVASEDDRPQFRSFLQNCLNAERPGAILLAE